jgi:hypothetical protein
MSGKPNWHRRRPTGRLSQHWQRTRNGAQSLDLYGLLVADGNMSFSDAIDRLIGILSMRGSKESRRRRAFERRVAQPVAAPSPALPAAPLRAGRPLVSLLAIDRRYAVPGLEIPIDPMTLMFDLCVERAVTTLAATLDRSLDIATATATAPSSPPPPPSAYRSMGRRAAKHAPSCRP